MKKYLSITMPDNSEWEVPVDVIAKDRATHYFNRSKEFTTFQEAYKETMDLFNSDDFEIEDWAQNNMDWKNIESEAKRVKDGSVDYDEGWVTGEIEIVEH